MPRRSVCLVATLALCACSADQGTDEARGILVTNVTIVSSHPAGPQLKTNVFMHDGRIAAIGEHAGTRASDDSVRIDGDGQFLIPGLIDGHTHLNEVPGMTFEHEQKYPEVAAEARAQIPLSYLYHGFTTVVDLNGHPDAIRAWNDVAVAPRAYFCGGAPVFDGYPMSFMPKPQRYEMMPYFLYDETRSSEFPAHLSPDRSSPKAVVDRIRDDGGICVKTHFERGFGGRGDLPVPSLALIRELIEAAHENEMPVLLHANSQSAQVFGNEAGVDAFAHGMWTWDDRSRTEIHAEIEAIADISIANNIALQPTIQVLYGEQDIHNPDFFDDARLQHVLPASLINWYGTEDGQWWRLRMLNVPIVATLVEKGLWQELDAPPIARVSSVTSYFVENGGQLLFGSDTPSDPTFANPPGLNGRIEMDRLVEAGASAEQLFNAATIENAEFFGLDHEIGTVEVGKRADLLLLQEDPRIRVSAYDTIRLVIVNGELHERPSLSAVAD